MGRGFFSQVSLIALLALGLMGCSDEDRANCPGTDTGDHYRIVYSYVDPNFSTLVIDSRNGEVIDSIPYGPTTGGFTAIVFSPDGDKVYLTRSGSFGQSSATWVTDATMRDTLTIHEGKGGHAIALSPDANYLLTYQSGVNLFSLADLSLVFQARDGFHAVFNPKRPELYFSKAEFDTFLYRLDLNTDPFEVDSFLLMATPDYSISPQSFEVTKDGRTMVISNDFGYGRLEIVDTDSFKTSQTLLMSDYSSGYVRMAWQPDSTRLFLILPGFPGISEDGQINVLDVRNLEVSDYLTPIDVGLERGFNPIGVTFLPGGNEMVVTTNNDVWTGPILQVTVGTKKVRQTLYRNTGITAAVGVDPKPFQR